MDPSTSRIGAVDEGGATPPATRPVRRATTVTRFTRLVLVVVVLLTGSAVVAPLGASASLRYSSDIGLAGNTGSARNVASVGDIASAGDTGSVEGPEERSAEGVGRFIAVGDSILLGARAQLDSRVRFFGWPAVLDLEVSRSTAVGAQVLGSLRPGPDDVVVISLGANDSGDPGLFRSRAERVLAAGADAAAIFWLTIAEVRPYYPGTNAIIRELAEVRPNVVVVDWAASVASDPTLTARDGLHLTPVGTVAMADQIFGTMLGLGSGAPEVDPGPAPDPAPAEQPAAVSPLPPASTVASTVTVPPPAMADPGPGASVPPTPEDTSEEILGLVDDEAVDVDEGGGRGPTVGLVIGVVLVAAVGVSWLAIRRRSHGVEATSHNEHENEHQKT